MYVIDYIWKLMLIRMEYHLDDEEQRLRKVEKYFKDENVKQLRENEMVWKIREDEYMN
jgi:hypothetical protein